MRRENKNQVNLCIPNSMAFFNNTVSTRVWTEMLINHTDNSSCQASLPNHTSRLLTEKLCLPARKLWQSTDCSGAYSIIPKKQINTQAKLMLRRSNYLKGQKELGHWDRECKSGYLVISTIPRRHMHSAVIIQWAEYGKQREPTLQIKLCSKCSFSQLLFEMQRWNHGVTFRRVQKGVTRWKSALQCNRALTFFQRHFKALAGGWTVRTSPQPWGNWGLCLPDPQPHTG